MIFHGNNARFVPGIPVEMYHGTPEEREHKRNHKLKKLDTTFPVVVTSYEVIMRDRKYLSKYQWKYIIVDEGHRLKNMDCKLIRELKSYHSANRLLLTGTPLQNNLSELWSLLNFLLPDIFDDREGFEEWFDFSDINAKEGQDRILGEESQSGIVSSLHHILKPFLLRRVKTDGMSPLHSAH
jgi:ATP-dependent DNA helicase